VGEVSEPTTAGRGVSSSMPHKRNPVAAAVAVAASVQAPGLVATMLTAMPQEHERALGGWQAEWDTLPALVDLAARSSAAMAEALPHLVVHEHRMRGNLDADGGVARAEGLVTALASHIGRGDALALVEGVCATAVAQQRPLAEVAAVEPRIRDLLDLSAIDEALAPGGFAGSSRAFVDRVLARWPRPKK
jgi:3-carboxy-cis,cis-muconate cycloisomerase